MRAERERAGAPDEAELIRFGAFELELEAGEVTPGSPPRRCPDMSKTYAATRFAPQVPLAVGLKETADWYRANQRSSVGVAAE